MRGIQSAPLVSQILLYNDVYSSTSSLNGSQRSWAGIFDRNCIWPLILDIKSNLYPNPQNAFLKIKDLYEKVLNSWEIQLELVYQLHTWLTIVFEFFVVGIIGTLLAKYLPQSLHSVSELLPKKYSIKTRVLLSSALFFALIFIGFTAWIWITFFLLWRHLHGRDKVLGGIVLGIFMLYPLNLKVDDMFYMCNDPASAPMLLKKSLDEGYYPEFEEYLQKSTQTNSSNFLIHTGMAVSYLRKQDTQNALSHIRQAQQLAPTDPVVLTVLGNVLYQSGQLNEAKNTYLECIESNFNFAPAYFNCGQYFFNAMETAKGMEYISKAARINPLLINSHIKISDDFFSKDWPIARQLISPDYTPGYFWKHIFTYSANHSQGVDKRFGVTFFGFSFFIYAILSLILFCILIVSDMTVWSRDVVKKIYSCKLCQTPICRKCKRGGICQDCFNSTQHIRNESIRQRIMSKIQFKSVRLSSLRALILDVVFPGAGMVQRNSTMWLSIPILLLTSIVYGIYSFILFPAIVFPSWLLHGVILPFFVLCVLYNAFFIGRAASLLVKEMKIRGE